MKKQPPRILFALGCLPILVSSTPSAHAETVFGRIEAAGARDTIGTTVETSNDASSQAFPEIPGIYWITKHTFIRATESWNVAEASAAAREDRTPEIVSRTVMQMIRNDYLHAVKKLVPTLNQANGYSRQDIDFLTGAIAPNLEKLNKSGGKQELLNELASPNPLLAKELKDYYYDLFVEEEENPRSLLSRMTDDRIRGGGAPILGLARKFSRFECRVVDASTQLSVQAPKVRLVYEKEGIFGPANSTFYFNPAVIVIPAGNWKIEIEAVGYDTLEDTVTLEEGAPLKREFELQPKNTNTPPTPEPREGRPRTARPSGSEVRTLPARIKESREHYLAALGEDSVILYDREPALQRFASLPPNLGNQFKTLPLLNSVPTEVWNKVGRGSRVHSGISGTPNPAINDSCLNIKFVEGDLRQVYPSAELASFHDDIKAAVVEWANSAYGDSEHPHEKLATFSIDDEFFARLFFRAEFDGKDFGGRPHPHYDAEKLPVRDYVKWNRADYEKFRKGREFLGPVDQETDLVIRFVHQFSIRDVDVDALAAFRSNADGKAGGVIEIRCDPEWSFVTGDGLRHGENTNTWPFRAVILHELGHYLGLRHLPNREGVAFLENCVMRDSCSDSCSYVTPIDAMLLRYFEYQPLQLRGNSCGGLLAK